MHDHDNYLRSDARLASDFGIDDVIAFLRRQGLLMVATGGLAALTAGGVAWTQPRAYESTATLVVFPPRVSSELKPATLSALGLQQLLEADAVVRDAQNRLIAEGHLAEQGSLNVPTELSSRIFVSRRTEDKELAPMIQITGRAPSAEAAAAYTNTWAEVFLERIRSLVTRSTAATIEFVDREYEQQREALAASEDRLIATQITHRRAYGLLAEGWLGKLAKREAQNADAIAVHETETSRLIETYRGGKNFETRRSLLEAMRQALVDLQVEQASIESRLARARLTLEALQELEKKIPSTITTRKAITDDALWNALGGTSGEAVDWKDLASRSLVSESTNPVFSDLQQRIGVAVTNEAALRPRAAQLAERIGALGKEMAEIEASLREDQAGLVALEQVRAAGYERLRVGLEAELESDSLRRDRELESDRQKSDNLFAQLTRAIDQRKQLFSEMSKSFNEAVIAKAQQDLEEVRLGAPAVPPDDPLPRRLLIKAIIGGLLGAGLGFLIGVVRYRRPVAAA